MIPGMEDHINNNFYVCITHQTVAPCNDGDKHLISNWNTDVKKILDLIEKDKTIGDKSHSPS